MAATRNNRRLGQILRTVTQFYLGCLGVRRFPSSLFWMITWECNSRCLHCEWGKPSGGEQLPLSRIKATVSEAKAHGASHIAFAGGEAFLRRDFLEIIRHCKDEGFAVTVSSNGFLMKDAAFARRVVETGIDRLDISLDAADRVHDELRGVRGAFGMVDAALDNLSALKRERDFFISLNVVVSGFNLHKLPDIFAYARRKGVDGVGLQPFHPVQARDKGLIPKFMLGGGQIAGLRKTLKKIIAEYGDLVSNSKFFVENIPRYYENPAMPAMGCYAGLQEIHLYPDGSISGCCFLKGTDSVRTRSLKELLASEAFKDILRKTRAKKCPHCWSPPVHEYNLLLSPKALLSGFKLAKTYLRWSRR